GLESLKKADNHEEFTYSQLLNDSGTSTTLLIACVIWMTSGFLYYGITLSAGSISDEVLGAGGIDKLKLSVDSISNELHLNMFLMGIVEIPAYIVTPYLADNIGRKHSFMLFNVLAALFLPVLFNVLAAFFCLVSWVYPRKQGRLLFALCGKICGSAVFSLCWIWAPEIFPTRARSLTTAIGSQAARVGSIVAPYVVVLMSEMSTGTIGPDGKPEPVFAVAAMSSLLFAYYLPETKDLDVTPKLISKDD
ncbi:major facilitator superfamily domain-containing protein, partial [Baffinella frigidus]